MNRFCRTRESQGVTDREVSRLAANARGDSKSGANETESTHKVCWPMITLIWALFTQDDVLVQQS
jgi:hypothetical protein